MQNLILSAVVLMVYFSHAVLPCQSAFQSFAKRKKPRDTLKFIDIPRTNEEQELKRKGYGEQFYSGVDEAHYLIQLGKYLRENSIDPRHTHIENFVPLIARHYQHLKEGWQYYGPIKLGPPDHFGLWTSKTSADMNYRILRNRWASYIGSALFLSLSGGYIRKTDQPLSLEVWQNLNLWWAILMAPVLFQGSQFKYYFNIVKNETPNQSPVIPSNHLFHLFKKTSKNTTNKSKEDFQQYGFSYSISFPERVVLPTTTHLGIFALNQVAGGEKVIPVELSNRVHKQDKVLMDPLRIFTHDLDHIEKANYGQPLFDNPLFHHQLMSYFKKLPPQKREQAEIIYFILIHELEDLTENFPSIEAVTDKPSLLKILSSSFVAGATSYIYEPSGAGVLEAKIGFEWDKNKDFFENERIHFNKVTEYLNQQNQEWMDSLLPEIRDLFNQTDVVVETTNNPQLLEESTDVFIQAVQHVLQNNPDIIRN